MKSVNDLISNIFNILKSPKLLVWTALTSALFLYTPTSTVPYHGFQDFKNQYGIWGLFILIGSIAMLAIEFTIYIYKIYKHNQYRKKIKNRLESLNDSEKSILREFYIQNQHFIKMPIDNVNVLSLADAGIIKFLRMVVEFHFGSPLGLFSITETAAKFITHELLCFPLEGPTPENIEKIHKLRPTWALEIENKDRIWEKA